MYIPTLTTSCRTAYIFQTETSNGMLSFLPLIGASATLTDKDFLPLYYTDSGTYGIVFIKLVQFHSFVEHLIKQWAVKADCYYQPTLEVIYTNLFHGGIQTVAAAIYSQCCFGFVAENRLKMESGIPLLTLVEMAGNFIQTPVNLQRVEEIRKVLQTQNANQYTLADYSGVGVGVQANTLGDSSATEIDGRRPETNHQEDRTFRVRSLEPSNVETDASLETQQESLSPVYDHGGLKLASSDKWRR